MFSEYDIIVVGAGHAGCEAANAAAKMGSKVLLITMNMNTIAQMSCNPAMGGVAKGQIVREIDALGGMSGIISDKSMIQFRMLNKSKGPAMWSPRTQNDRMRFAEEWRLALEANPNVDFWQEMVTGIITEGNKVVGVSTGMGIEFKAKAVVLTNGTFLNGIIHIGEKQFGGGRTGERAAKGITEQLVQLGFEAGRMKTGTPPRVDGRSLDYSKMEEQAGDEKPGKFSYSHQTSPLIEQRSCFITYTNPTVHEILETGFDRSPMFNGRIRGLGPRYCPSIEDKINRFAERSRHQIFVEPEGWNTVEVYVNGFSTSLPEDVQYKALKSVKGFENVKPMVFAGIFPIDNDDYEDLRDSLEKLQLNDASLVFEPETSVALGFGFRCGFLGMLHLEIIQERLSREYEMEVITTIPNVSYFAYTKKEEEMEVRTPADLPDMTKLDRVEEPYIIAQIITKPEYIGAIMTLCMEKRGILTKQYYLTEDRVELTFDLPLAEIVFDFYDRLKSLSRGYASFDYAPSEYRPSDLVKMDIKLNGDAVDALSALVHRDKAQAFGRKICKRLKELLPRQQFMIAIQAAIGAKIIARETISALRKDVTAKCYGGDITRKRKLLEKQKKGKKKMRQIGSVEVPQKAFLDVLKLD